MATTEHPDGLSHRSHVKAAPSNEISSHAGGPADAQGEELRRLQSHVQKVKVKVLEELQGQLNVLLDKALAESLQPLTQRTSANGKMASSHRSHRMEDGKVFMQRASLLDELFEISHIRTIYHMFVAVLLVFSISTLAVDFIDQGRLVLEFDLLFFAFGGLGTVTWAWASMFVYTLVVPYHAMALWGAAYHRAPRGGLFPVYVVVHYQLPPASRFIVTLEQIRFLMKSYSFIRESVPFVTRSSEAKEGETQRFPTFSSYLYFLFCPTLIYKESYPRNPYIRWNYVGVTAAMILGCLFYGYFILPCSIPHYQLLRFGDRMFYKDWWNSTSFANYYRTWNVVVHDWLYYYGYRDFLWYAFTMGFGFFYPVMFCLFSVFGVTLNFALNDKRQSPLCNILMWTSLFIGQGVQVCLYSQEWYAQIQCPRTGNSFWELVTPRSWSCTYPE
ncbi:hypothetical protein NHX12_030988 [Muraenolepis orangiensis]|uniref:O-acyltransferase n=1 Tax=Muraenolepis orangiensis TaxID=630683 RepID=A0A9Q0EAK9_9TELE|nr:hypothetical protein NHX12_030988 [Muraenolepis orangiensis]